MMTPGQKKSHHISSNSESWFHLKEKAEDIKLLWLHEVLTSGSCTGCATCSGICKNNALHMAMQGDGTWVPVFDPSKCIQCGRCQKVCPSNHFDSGDFNALFPDNAFKSAFLGTFMDSWLGYASDQGIRCNGTSGGIISALLEYLFSKNEITGAVIVEWSADKLLVPRTKIITSRAAVSAAAGAKYFPVNHNDALSYLSRAEGSYAYIGLPCHIRGLRMAQKVNPGLKNKITFVFGLTCSHTIERQAFEYVASVYGIKMKEIASISMAGNGWPGGLRVRLKDERSIFIPRFRSLWSAAWNSHFFTPDYCLQCPDVTAELSDISVGDAWLREIVRNDKKGTSLILTRTEKGHELIEWARKDRAITLNACRAEDIIRSQKTAIRFKKRNVPALRFIRKMSGKSTCKKPAKALNAVPADYLVAGYVLLVRWFTKLKLFKKWYKYLPPKFFRGINTIGKGLSLILNRTLSDENLEKTILITNQHTDNRGDQAALFGMIHALKARFPESKINVQMQWAETDMIGNRFQNVHQMGMITKYHEALKTLLYVMSYKISGIRMGFLLSGELYKKIDAYETAAVVISAPGGPYIGDSYADHEHAHWFHIWIAQTLGKPVILYAPSVGPFNIKWRNIFRRYLLNRMRSITVRELFSFHHIKTLGVSIPGVEIASDSALQLQVNKCRDSLTDLLGDKWLSQKGIIGFTPCQWKYPGFPDPEVKQQEYCEAVARSLDRCIKKYDTNIIVFPQLFGRHSDLQFINKIKKMMKGENRVFILSDSLDCIIQQAVIGRCDAFIATRYHSQIFAAKMSVPGVCIYYEHKALGFMKHLQMTDYAIDINKVTEESLNKTFDTLWENRTAIAAHYKKVMPKLIKDAYRSSEIVNEAMEFKCN